MEMNPFKPMVQFCEGLYEAKLALKIPILKVYLNISLVKNPT